ncbi:YqjD family protein [soil metagenome]
MLSSKIETVHSDMRTLVKDAQDLFREATAATGEKAEVLRAKGMSMLEAASGKAQDLQASAIQTGKELAETTDTFVQENPWKAVAISAGVGLLIGVLIARR